MLGYEFFAYGILAFVLCIIALAIVTFVAAIVMPIYWLWCVIQKRVGNNKGGTE